MPRPRRIQVPDGIHHVTARGNNKATLFGDEADYLAFQRSLESCCEEVDLRLVARCLMPNHVHLVIRTVQPDLPKAMHRLLTGYAKRYNTRYERTGHVFQGRYHATFVDRDPYLLEVVRYVLLNPVRAGLCASPTQWRWSSAREAFAEEPARPCTDLTICYGLLGPADGQEPRRLREFVLSALKDR